MDFCHKRVSFNMMDHISNAHEDMSYVIWLKHIDDLKENICNLANRTFKVYLAIKMGIQKKRMAAREVNEIYYTYLQFHENTFRLMNQVVQIIIKQFPKGTHITMSFSDAERLQNTYTFIAEVEREIMSYKANLDDLIQRIFPMSELHNRVKNLV